MSQNRGNQQDRDGEKGRTPDYNVSALDKTTGKKGRIGAAWDNEDGSITMVLNICVVLDTRTQDLNIRLFPNDKRQKWEE